MEAKLLPDSFNPNFFDAKVSHFIQSWRWGVMRKETGVPVLRIALMQDNELKNVAQITLHKIPKTKYSLGLLSKCAPYSKEELEVLRKIGKQHHCIAIRLEPDVILSSVIAAEAGIFNANGHPTAKVPDQVLDNTQDWPPHCPALQRAPRNYYIPHNYLIDLTRSEDQLLAAMESKTRYNIRVAQKHGVTVEEKTDTDTLEQFIALQKDTAKRQKFYLHPDDYYRTVFKIFAPAGNAKLLIASHPNGTALTIWFLMIFKKTVTYLYGASNKEHKEMMANNLIAWEAMRFGKSLDLTEFDFGGSLGQDADPKDPRFGFHRFKKGFGGKHVSYVGTFDLVINLAIYHLFTKADTLRWWLLRLRKS